MCMISNILLALVVIGMGIYIWLQPDPHVIESPSYHVVLRCHPDQSPDSDYPDYDIQFAGHGLMLTVVDDVLEISDDNGRQESYPGAVNVMCWVGGE